MTAVATTPTTSGGGNSAAVSRFIRRNGWNLTLLGVLALMVALCVRLYERYGTFDITEIRRLRG